MFLISSTATASSAFSLSTVTAAALFFPGPAMRGTITTKSKSFLTTSFSSKGGGVGSKSAALEMGFPYLSETHQELMSDLISTLESALGPHLDESDDGIVFQNESGSSNGGLKIVNGGPDSPVDSLLLSWINSKLPFGTLNITTLLTYLDSKTTRAPHLWLEFIQNSPTSMVFLADLIPREDLILHHDDYLHRYYEQGKLEEIRQSLSSLPSVEPFVLPTLFYRSLVSPTSLVVTVNCEEEEGGMDSMLRDHVGVAAKKMVEYWVESCALDEIHKPKPMSAEEDPEVMIRTKRDNVIKNRLVEIDLSVNLPKLFGKEVGDKIFAKVVKSLRIE